LLAWHQEHGSIRLELVPKCLGTCLHCLSLLLRRRKKVCLVQYTFVGFGDFVNFCWLWFSRFYLVLVRYVCLSLLCLFVTQFVVFCWFSLVWPCNVVSILCPTICWFFFHQLWWIIDYFKGTVWKVLLVRFLFFWLLLEELFIAIGEWGMLVTVMWFEEVWVPCVFCFLLATKCLFLVYSYVDFDLVGVINLLLWLSLCLWGCHVCFVCLNFVFGPFQFLVYLFESSSLFVGLVWFFKLC